MLFNFSQNAVFLEGTWSLLVKGGKKLNFTGENLPFLENVLLLKLPRYCYQHIKENLKAHGRRRMKAPL